MFRPAIALVLVTLPGVASADRFVKGASPAVYSVKNDVKRWITHPECYFSIAGKKDWSDVENVPDAQINAWKESAPIFCDKSFIKFSDSAAVYMATGNTLRLLNDPNCAFANGVARDWKNVVTVDAKWSAHYGYGKLVCGGGKPNPLEGRFVKGAGPAVYSVRDKSRRWIVNPEAYFQIAGKNDWSDTETIPDAEINGYTEATPLYGDKSFIKFKSSATVYLATGNTLRAIEDPPCAFANGVAQNWSNVITLDDRWADHFGYGKSVCPKGGAAAPPPPPPPPAAARDCGTGKDDPGCNKARNGNLPMTADIYSGLMATLKATANELVRKDMVLTAFEGHHMTARQFVAFLELFNNELVKMEVATAGAPRVVDPAAALGYGAKIRNSITRGEYNTLILEQK